MTDEEWRDLVEEALAVRRQIISDGQMATKSAVEDVLMKRHDIDRCVAHDVMNHIERNNLR